MSFLAQGKRRGRRSVALVAVGALMAFQALAIVGATSAFAISSCTFSGGTLSIVLSGGESIVFSQNASGDVLVNGADTTVAPCSTTRATVTNTTAISVTGFTGAEDVTIEMYEEGGDDIVSWGTINWTINLASGTADVLTIDGSGLTDATPDALDIALGASGIDLNNDDDLDVTLAAVEDVFVDGGDADDTIWAAGSTATGAAFTVNLTATGGDGDDTLASGAGDDDLDGGVEVTLGDTIDFSGATAGVNVNLLGGVATGMGSDILGDFENIVGSAFNDSLTGDAQINDIAPGLGDDTINGGDEFDYVDYFDAPAAVTVDLAANTATGGSGNDALGTSIEGAVGSDFDDSFIDQTNQDNEYFGLAGADTFSQGADPAAGDVDFIDGDSGVDWVDYSERTEANEVDLDEADDDTTPPTDTTCVADGSGDINDGELDEIVEVENAMLGSGDDTFCGSAFGNTVKPGGGQNVLDGNAGSDTLDYADYEAGVEVNMAGGATAGDSAVEFENAKGSAFNDNITGNELSNTLKAGKGNDNVKGGGGDDTIRGAGGKDRLRGGSGDDDLFGGAGNDGLFGGGGTDLGNGGKGKDVCKGVEIRRSCGTKKNPKAPALQVAARLV
jgi:Ca2+-binding RTX toxin-like protein